MLPCLAHPVANCTADRRTAKPARTPPCPSIDLAERRLHHIKVLLGHEGGRLPAAAQAPRRRAGSSARHPGGASSRGSRSRPLGDVESMVCRRELIRRPTAPRSGQLAQDTDMHGPREVRAVSLHVGCEGGIHLGQLGVIDPMVGKSRSHHALLEVSVVVEAHRHLEGPLRYLLADTGPQRRIDGRLRCRPDHSFVDGRGE